MTFITTEIAVQKTLAGVRGKTLDSTKPVYVGYLLFISQPSEPYQCLRMRKSLCTNTANYIEPAK